jgi:hypothetical protein
MNDIRGMFIQRGSQSMGYYFIIGIAKVEGSGT